MAESAGQQLIVLWANKGNGQAANGNGRTDATPEHHCLEHSVPFKRHEMNGSVWYSHKANGKWCNEWKWRVIKGPGANIPRPPPKQTVTNS